MNAFFPKLAVFPNVHGDLCMRFVLVIVCCHHCVVAHPGRREAIQKEIGNPTSEKNYKRATLRNAVGEYTCIQEHNE